MNGRKWIVAVRGKKENDCFEVGSFFGNVCLCVEVGGKWQNVKFGENSHTIAVVWIVRNRTEQMFHVKHIRLHS